MDGLREGSQLDSGVCVSSGAVLGSQGVPLGESRRDGLSVITVTF